MNAKKAPSQQMNEQQGTLSDSQSIVLQLFKYGLFRHAFPSYPSNAESAGPFSGMANQPNCEPLFNEMQFWQH